MGTTPGVYISSFFFTSGYVSLSRWGCLSEEGRTGEGLRLHSCTN